MEGGQVHLRNSAGVKVNENIYDKNIMKNRTDAV